MIEFGSDFHRCSQAFNGEVSIEDFIKDIRYYACGRHAFDALILQEKWKRIWFPAYFCYEVIDHIKSLGITIGIYDDHPLNENQESIVRSLPYEDGDVLLRMNYFGLRTSNDNSGIPVPVIEDHTHSLSYYCLMNSHADWCVASVRKSVPVAAGGILWTPKGHNLPQQLPSTVECESMATIRYCAMDLKTDYLERGGDKDGYRSRYLQSEELIEQMELSGMDNESYKILQSFDINKWNDQKRQNWVFMAEGLDDRFSVIRPAELASHPFSLVILCKSPCEHSSLRQYLIENKIYPAVLWPVPDGTPFKNASDLSQRLISLHCDPRYSKEEVQQMCRIINSYYD